MSLVQDLSDTARLGTTRKIHLNLKKALRRSQMAHIDRATVAFAEEQHLQLYDMRSSGRLLYSLLPRPFPGSDDLVQVVSSIMCHSLGLYSPVLPLRTWPRSWIVVFIFRVLEMSAVSAPSTSL